MFSASRPACTPGAANSARAAARCSRRSEGETVGVKTSPSRRLEGYGSPAASARAASVARMSGAKSGTVVAAPPAYRFAHAGYDATLPTDVSYPGLVRHIAPDFADAHPSYACFARSFKCGN